VLPTNPDHNGFYEDLNGRKDFTGVQLYFEHVKLIGENEPLAAFDMKGNGRIDFDDIVKLFNEI
jgi:hypothetical protein